MKKNYEQIIGFLVSNRALFAYSRYWLHKYQAVLQFDRMQSALHEKSLCGEWLKEPDIKQSDAIRLWFHFGGLINKKALSEIHLFFIAVDNLKDMMNTILSEKKLVPLKKTIGKFIYSLEHYIHGRNTFEHYDDRIPGRTKHEKVAEVKASASAAPRRILGGLKGSTYTFGDKKWDLTSKDFQKILDGLNAFEVTLHGYLNEIKKTP